MATINVHVSDELLAELQSKAVAEGNSSPTVLNVAAHRAAPRRTFRASSRIGDANSAAGD
jgi:hypothetical protein